MTSYCIIDETDMVINILNYSGDNDLTDHHCGKPVKNTASACIGWTYKDGQFIEPYRNPNPPPLPDLPKDPKDKQIEDLKADVQTLSASLTQVINTLNNLTRPTSATKNNPAM